MKREEDLRDRSYVPAALFFAFVAGGAVSSYLYFRPTTSHAGVLSGARVDLILDAPSPSHASAPAQIHRTTTTVPIHAAPRFDVAFDGDHLGLDALAAKNPALFGARGPDRELESALAGVLRVEKSELTAEVSRSMIAPRTEPATASSPFISRLNHNMSRPEVGELEKSESSPAKLRYGRSISAELDMAAVRETIEAKLHEARICYERAAELDSGLFGVVRVAMTIDRTGAVESVSFGESTLENDELSRCLARRIKQWRFPAPNGVRATVDYPLVFNRS